MNNVVYITGHRNPDLDSVCSAYAYAVLKNRMDKSCKYRAVTCSPVSNNVKKQIEYVGISSLPCVSDVYPKVSDVMLSSEGFEADQPIYDLVKTYTTQKPSVVPLFSHGSYYGLLSVDDITAWFLKDNSVDNPVYDFSIENIQRVIPGTVLHCGNREKFTASIMAGAADYEEFSSFVERDNSGVVVMGLREKHIRRAMEAHVPAIIITTVKQEIRPEINGYDGLVYVTSLDTAEVIRRLRMAQPLSSIMGEQMPPIQATDRFEETKETFIESRVRGLAVMDGEKYVGFVTRRCFLKSPINSVIMMDHNEQAQSIRGIETAFIEEIVDHHRLNAIKTDLPIFIDVEPVGSTCTIVLTQFVKNAVGIDALTARVILTGILADTLMLKSPTTTQRDRDAVKYLSEICDIDADEYGKQLLSMTESLATADPEEAIHADCKCYEVKGLHFAISQCEATTLKDVPEYADKYLERLESIRKESALDWMVLMITDVLREHSILLVTDHKAVKKLPFARLKTGIYDMPSVMSRKKQLLPILLHILEG